MTNDLKSAVERLGHAVRDDVFYRRYGDIREASAALGDPQ